MMMMMMNNDNNKGFTTMTATDHRQHGATKKREGEELSIQSVNKVIIDSADRKSSGCEV